MRVEEQLQSLRAGEPVVIKSSVTSLLVGLVVALAFTALGLWLLSVSQSEERTAINGMLIGGMCVGVFGVIGIPLVVYQLLVRGRMIVTRDGFAVRPALGSKRIAGRDMLRWSEIAQVTEVRRGRRGSFRLIAVYLTPAAAALGLHRPEPDGEVVVPDFLRGRHEDRLALLQRAHAEFGGPGFGGPGSPVEWTW